MVVYLTHGAKKNVGDYLIHARGRALFEHILPDTPVRSIARWSRDPLPDDADQVVMCGGPGVSSRMVEDTFPVVDAARDAGVPVAGLALGWSGLPARDPRSFQMSVRTLDTLRRINQRDHPLTVRDDVTLDILKGLGVEAIRTGCTAWYSVPDLGAPAHSYTTPETVVFTTPASPKNTSESIAIMRSIKRRYPNARLVASFHRGVLPDKETDVARSAALVAQSLAARMLGFEVIDAAYELAKIDFYRDADLHVGYRVHAHLAFVSQRRASVLICEDGRGYGQAITLGSEEDVLWAGSAGLVQRLDELLSREERSGWPTLDHAIEIIEETYPVMKGAVAEFGAR